MEEPQAAPAVLEQEAEPLANGQAPEGEEADAHVETEAKQEDPEEWQRRWVMQIQPDQGTSGALGPSLRLIAAALRGFFACFACCRARQDNSRLGRGGHCALPAPPAAAAGHTANAPQRCAAPAAAPG